MDNRPLRQEDYLAMSEQHSLLIVKNERLERINKTLQAARWSNILNTIGALITVLALGVGIGVSIGIASERVYTTWRIEVWTQQAYKSAIKFKPNPYIDWELDRLNE